MSLQNTTRAYRPSESWTDAIHKQELESLLDTCSENMEDDTIFIDIHCLQNCVQRLKPHKSAGHDKISNEHIIHGSSELIIHLNLLFNALIKHCFVPSDFCFSLVVPLLKNKHGDATKLDMYRGITLSSVVSCLKWL